MEDNFIKVNDDSVKLFWGDTVARGNTIWQLENGASFMISWNIHQDSDTFHVYDNDVIHAEHYELQKPAIFRALHAGSGTLSRYLFEDIRIENATWRLFYLAVENNKWYDPVFWAPKDKINLIIAEKFFGLPDQFTYDNVNLSFSTYCFSPAAMWAPENMARPRA